MLRKPNIFPHRIHAFLCSSSSSYYYYSSNSNANSISPSSKSIRRLEVERKFLATPASIAYLRSNGGGSSFKSHESLGKQTTHDTYYDQNNTLFSRGIYVRRRNGHWEAKIRSSGDFINSAFTELDGNSLVMDLVKKTLPTAADGRGIEDILDPCADFTTERESWIIDGSFVVDVDTTDFGHIVGEVELTRTLQETDGSKEETRLRRKMDQEIGDFMQSYPQAFPAGRPLGKLSAYFNQQREKQNGSNS